MPSSSDTVTDTLALTHSDNVGIGTSDAQTLGLAHSVPLGLGLGLVQVVGMTQGVHPTIGVTVTQGVTLTQDAHGNYYYTLSHTLGLAQADASAQEHIVTDLLNLVQVEHDVGTYFPQVTQSLTFTQGTYAAKSNVACVDDYDVEPPIVPRNAFTLTWPFVSPTKTVVLRTPKFGNSDNIQTNAVVRRTMANDLSEARDVDWPTIERLKFAFEALDKTQVNALLDFAVASLGQEVGILDHESRQWRGVILTAISVVQGGRDCDFDASFEFMGRLA